MAGDVAQKKRTFLECTQKKHAHTKTPKTCQESNSELIYSNSKSEWQGRQT